MREATGIAASGGIFIGPVRMIGITPGARRTAGTAAEEEAALRDAIAASIAAILELAEHVGGDGADVLAFQAAMLEDEELSAPAFDTIRKGEAADAAWRAALDHSIAEYQAAEDEAFRARSADFADMRDRVLRHLAGEAQAQHGAGAVLAGDDIAPSLFLSTDWSSGGAIALAHGSPNSHVAMLARARGVPMVTGLGPINGAVTAAVNGETGVVIFDPAPGDTGRIANDQAALAARAARDAEFLLRPAMLKNGRRIELLVNLAGVDELEHLDVRCCDGIGLMRSEFLFRDGAPLPDEEQQYRAYRRFVDWAQGRPVTIRTLDIGGDKPIAGLTPQGEHNPFLGLRGVRLTLSRPDVFRTQLRALARAAAHGPLKIMIPMVTVPREITETVALLEDCVAALARQGTPAIRPPLGIMVEVPAVAIAPELFGDAAFFSIGSNDLTQYVTAASRDGGAVAALNDPSHPAVIRLISQVTAFGRARNIPVSLCGDMASEPRHLAALIRAGVTALSVAPARIARVKAALAELEHD